MAQQLFYQLWEKGKARTVSTQHVNDDGDSDVEEGRTQYACMRVMVYRADGLLRWHHNILHQLGCSGNINPSVDLVNPFVEVCFAELKGSTKEQKRTSQPIWNQQIVFTCPFPLPDEPLVLHMHDDTVGKHEIGCIHLPLDSISSPDHTGFLPMFGPSYVYLKKPKNKDDPTAYLGRVLVAVTTEIMEDAEDLLKPNVKVEATPPVPGPEVFDAEFLLFACLQEATMIDKRFTHKEFRVTLQKGDSARNQLEIPPDSDCATPFSKPVSVDNQYCYIPFEESKPCMWLTSTCGDQRKRMFVSNIISKMEQKLEEVLAYVGEPDRVTGEKNQMSFEESLKDVEQTAESYRKILQEYRGHGTELDKVRLKINIKDIDAVKRLSISARTAYNMTILDGALSKLERLRLKLKSMEDDPQSMVPDVVLWIECDKNRVGYAKIPARDLIHNVREYERGCHCGRPISLFFKPNVKVDEEWVMLAKVECILWLGLMRDHKKGLEMLPEGFTREYKTEAIPEPIPRWLHYYEKNMFELKAHIYQARSLACFDLSCYPSCFARVFIGEQNQITQVQESTVNPIFDEMLLFKKVIFHGDLQRVIESPPTVIVEIINYKAVGKARFLGRTVTTVPMQEVGEKPHALQWYDISLTKTDDDGQLLASFEFIQVLKADVKAEEEGKDPEENYMWSIPPEIRPTFSLHRMEILFWGLRELQASHWRNIDKPHIDVECAGFIVHSSMIANYKKHSNFMSTVEVLDMSLPDQEEYLPAFTIKLVHTKSFGRKEVIAFHVVRSLMKYTYKPRVARRYQLVSLNIGGGDDDQEAYIIKEISFPWTRTKRSHLEDDDEAEDWWSRYYISTGYFQQGEEDAAVCRIGESITLSPTTPRPNQPRVSIIGLKKFREVTATLDFKNTYQGGGLGHGPPNAVGFVVYPCELENVPEFDGFKEWLHSFELSRGNKVTRIRPRDKVVGVFKGCFRVYKAPLPQPAIDPLLPVPEANGMLFSGLPKNKSIKVLIRAYIVKALNLQPSDMTHTADAYIVLQLGRQRLSDKENYISKLLNPVFGKCFEFVANLPTDSILHVQVYDWELMATDKLIGETVIDLENRYYSRHRPTCGLARFYQTDGPNEWRDALKPTEILTRKCQESRLDGPYYGEGNIRIEKIVYEFAEEMFTEERTGTENMALCLLHRWSEIAPGRYSLTPEHIETRTLYLPEKPGEPQGQLVMWLDMFEEDTAPPSIPREISVRKPESYELRVVIWNTDEVVLVDDAFFTGEKMSDIYVKGWLTGKEDAQTTDIHYRSLTGEGNFNWRFIFPFDYLAVERQITVFKKVSVFSWDETEFKMPPFLQLEVWDADHFMPDDCLGTISLDLNRVPRGAKSAQLCTLDMLKKDGTVPQISLFKQKRMRGWWPFCQRQRTGKMEITGKVEAEFHLLAKEEAEKSPAGVGRKEPEPLEEPNRPKTSFVNWMNPLKTLRYSIWRNYKYKILRLLIIFALALLMVLFFYSVPGYAAKKILGA